MNEWSWNGARWWKFDFHTHTPASDDYGKGSDQEALKRRTPREWLLDYMRAEIDCVAVTDHNHGAWIDPLKQALAELDTEKPDGYRKLHLFPGIEISVNSGIHLLGIFDAETATADIDSLLGSVGFNGTRGSNDAVTTKSASEVVGAIVRAGGIAIPAHVDEPRGLFTTLQGQTLRQVLECGEVYAMEVVDPTAPKPGTYSASQLSWTEVLGTDAHHPSGTAGQRYPGSRFTWVKMGLPCIEGLRLALLDGELSVRRSDAASDEGDPSDHARLAIQSVEVENAYYMGRGSPFNVLMNPRMNAVIGGRGTGKSTLVEFMRLALRRDREIPDALKEDFAKYAEVRRNGEGSGLLTSDTKIRITYRKDGTVYRIQWDVNGSLEPIQQRAGQEWVRAEGDIRQRFPVRMYSQKQIFQMACTPLALLEIIDDAPEVGHDAWQRTWDSETSQYLSLRAKIREIQGGLSEERRLKGELEDVKRRLAVFEESGHAEILKALQKRRRQLRAVEEWESGLDEVSDRLRRVAEDITPEDLTESNFDEDKEEDVELLELAQGAKESIQEIVDRVKTLAGRADEAVGRWRQKKASSRWKAAADKAITDYETLRARLENEGEQDPSAYGTLVQRRQQIEGQLKQLQGRRERIAELEEQAKACLGRIVKLRRDITKKRRAFLEEALAENAHVRISILPYGAEDTVESQFRELIQRDAGAFEKDIGTVDGEGMLGDLYADGADAESIEKRLEELKATIRSIAADPDQAQVADKRFAAHLAKLPPEALDRLDVWFPKDAPDVEYSPAGNSQDFRPIHEGSPGQKTAALLAFLLSYGDEPLILDQPEDDLDNHLIYDLIVTQLREIKRSRQVIVVTHNANIVVNGDAELVVALAARGGRTQTEAEGCLQEKSVRQTICEVMEGGEVAFEERYRRIALETRHV